MDEPEFLVAYAKMCSVLREKIFIVPNDSGQPVDFRKVLLTRCQKEFERDYMEGFDKASFEANLAAAGSEERKKEMQLGNLENLSKCLQKSFKQASGPVLFCDVTT